MTTVRRDYYEVLGVRRDATAREIHRAFRTMARELHPDVSSRDDAAARFHELSTAYEVLHDPRARARYDRAVPRPRGTAQNVPQFLYERSIGRLSIVIRVAAPIRWLR